MQKNYPFFSIIIPVHNAAQFLPACLDSVFNQNETDFELICIDDASSDHSLSILTHYQKLFPEMHLIPLQNNVGPGAARNIGMRHARGQWLYFLDADDVCDISLLKCVHSKCAKNTLDVLTVAATILNEHGEQLTNNPFNPASQKFLKHIYTIDSAPYDYFRMPPHPSLNFYRRDFIMRHYIRFPEGIFFEDPVFHFSALWHRARFGYLTDPVVFYRVHQQSTSFAGDKKFFDIIPSYQLREKILRNTHQWKKLRQPFLNQKYRVFYNFLRLVRPKERSHLLTLLIRECQRDHLTAKETATLDDKAKHTLLYLKKAAHYSKIRRTYFMPSITGGKNTLTFWQRCQKPFWFLLFLPVFIKELHQLVQKRI